MKCKVIVNPSSGMKNFQRSAIMAMHKLSSEGVLTGAYLQYTTEKYDAYKIALDIKPESMTLLWWLVGMVRQTKL